MEHPAYGQLRRVSPAAAVVLERNPSAMTLEGTNSWILSAPGSRSCVVVDPGHDDPEHLATLADAAGEVELVVLTHRHGDHADGAPAFASAAGGVPVRAFDRALCRGADALAHAETFAAAGLTFTVHHTPGHTDDSVALTFEHDATRHVVTGDTILGYGTTIVDDLGDYLASLRAMAPLAAGAIGLPGHGRELGDLASTVQQYLDHREQRLDQIRRALDALGADATARQIVEHVYADVDRQLWPAAEVSVRAQLEYLSGGERTR